jgi:chromosome segregation ATPase
MNLWTRIVVLSAAVIANTAGLLWYGHTQYKAGYNAREAIAVKAAKLATDTARAKENALQEQKDEAQRKADEREKKLTADAIAARAAAGRLSGDLAALRRDLPKLTEQAVRQYADTASVVFGECAARYTELAEQADRIDSDRQTLEQAWPKQ